MKKPSPAAAIAWGCCDLSRGFRGINGRQKPPPIYSTVPLTDLRAEHQGQRPPLRASQPKKILKIIKKGEKYGSIVTADITI
ncbi:MAG: hypothetical protein Q8Q81_06245 [Oxalobacteraceae bacterium]|nr:hypothetical protein [Oxalobacteraceae bacterium]